jgi:DNA-binding response OmpR family regulator
MKKDTLPLSPLAMIVEDDEKLSEIYSMAVEAAGFTVRAIHQGDLALLEVAALQPRLVILDLQLPSVSGEVILKAIRGNDNLRKTKVIVTTADAIRASMLEEDGDLVLIKPVSFSQLRDLAFRIVKTRAWRM